MSLICSRTFLIADIAFLAAIAAERIEVERPAHRQHLVGIADDEHGADRLAFASFPADLGRQVDDGPQRFQRDLRVELAQVCGGQPFEMFAQMDDAEAIDVVSVAPLDADAVVECDDMGAGLSLSRGDRFEQSEAHAFLGRRRAGIDVEDAQVRIGLQVGQQLRLLGGNEQLAGRQNVEHLHPVEIGLSEEQDGIGAPARQAIAERLSEGSKFAAGAAMFRSLRRCQSVRKTEARRMFYRIAPQGKEQPHYKCVKKK